MDSNSETPEEAAGGSSPVATLRYRLCPQCARAVPVSSEERYCANDGTRLLDACPQCGAAITSPYARYCVRCGTNLQPPSRSLSPLT